MELELNEAPTADDLLARLQLQARPGLRIESLEVLPRGICKAWALPPTRNNVEIDS